MSIIQHEARKFFQLKDVKFFGCYPICIYFGDGNYKLEKFTPEGRAYIDYKLPQLFHATPENHELLEKLYGVEFEKPPVKLTSREIVRAMLARGDKCVPCWVSDCKENPGADSVLECIVGYSDDCYPFKLSNGGSWKYATPFDPRTGEAITELPE